MPTLTRRLGAPLVTIATCSLLASIAPTSGPLPHTPTPTARTVTAGPAPATATNAKDATRTRTLNGHFARVTYPVSVTSPNSMRVEVTLRHLRGKAPKEAYRRIRLMGASHGQPWKRVHVAHPKRSNTLTFIIPSPATASDYRVRLDLIRSGAKTITTAPFRIIVRDPAYYLPRGDANDWSSISGRSIDGTPVRWDPCFTIRWAFNANGTHAAYPQAMEDLTTVLGRISNQTGLRFTYVGPTAEVPYKSSEAILPEDDAAADLFIAFAGKDEVSAFGSAVIGLGGPLYYRKAVDNTLWIDTAGMLLDSSMIAGAQYRGSKSHKAMLSLMTHEALHALGLGHAKGEWQVMYPALRDTAKFGAGDITGMQIHGATHGCAAGYPDQTEMGYPSRAPASHVPHAPYVDTLHGNALLRR